MTNTPAAPTAQNACLGYVSDLGIIKFAFPLLVEAFVLIPPISEGPHSAHIEVILPHANTCFPHFTGWLVQHPLVNLQNGNPLSAY